MNEPSVLTRMRLSCCWGDNLNEKELNEVVDYINHLQRENKQLKVEIECFEKSSERKDYNIVEQQEKIVSLTIERDKYKSILEELDKWFKSDEFIPTPTNPVSIEIQCFIKDMKNKIKELEGSDK